LALVGVVALAGGVPAALIVWVGWPLPATVPTVDEVTTALKDTYIPDAFLIKTLAFVCWLIWVELMASLLVEAVAYFRGQQAGRVPMAGGVQRAAARMVATAALLGALLATRGIPEVASRALRPPSTVALIFDQQQPAPGELGDKERLPRPAAPPPVYQVVRRDTLWAIAEGHLGDPFRWPEIYDLNKGVPQADGRSLQDPDLIYPGWQLLLPADAFGLGPDAPAAPPPPPPPPPPAPAPPAPVNTTAPGSGGMVLVGEDQLTGSSGGGSDDVVVAAQDGMVLLSDDRRLQVASDQTQQAQPGTEND
jgi:hypothetical protein